MTIARRRAEIDTVAAPAPPRPAAPPPAPPIEPPVPVGDAPAPEVVTPLGRLRRCTFRRVDLVDALPGRDDSPAYEIMCLYADRDQPLPLGDIGHARPVCESCTLPGVFRPDED